MWKIGKVKIIVLLLLVLFYSNTALAGPEGRLKIYCGMTMLQAMHEIAKNVEKKYNCKPPEFVRGGSGEVLKELLENKDGDLFLPGKSYYIDKLDAEYPGFILQQAMVGYNQAGLFVKKGNPKGINPSLKSLLNPSYRIVLGDPSTGSIGRETERMLRQKGLYSEVMQHAKLTKHSKALIKSLKTNQADLTVNWLAVAQWPENKKFVDAYPLTSDCAGREKLVLVVLKTSNQAELANSFLEYAASDEGREIFKKYGLYN